MHFSANCYRLFLRAEFEMAVKQRRAERHARGFTCWGQFIAMRSVNWAGCLNEITQGLAASEGNLKHLYSSQRRCWLAWALLLP
jgi:uncharacterized protein DUF4372